MDDFCQRSWEQDAQLGLALSPLEHQEVPLEEDVLAVPVLQQQQQRLLKNYNIGVVQFNYSSKKMK
jgi:hypothetical protein